MPSKNIIEKINYDIINNTINQYRENEEDFKNKYFEQKQEFKEEKQKYENNKEILNKNILDNTLKFPIVKEIESILAKSEKIKFYKLLLDDYLFFFY